MKISCPLSVSRVGEILHLLHLYGTVVAAVLRSNYADWTVVANHPNCRVLGCDPTLFCTAESQISNVYIGGDITLLVVQLLNSYVFGHCTCVSMGTT